MKKNDALAWSIFFSIVFLIIFIPFFIYYFIIECIFTWPVEPFNERACVQITTDRAREGADQTILNLINSAFKN